MQSVIMKSSIAWTYQTESVPLVCVLVLAIISLSTSGKQTYTHLHHMKLVNCFPFLAPTALSLSLTSSVEEQGRQAACPGQELTFTCIVHDGTRLEWISDAFSGVSELFSLFLADDEVGVPRMYGQFTTNLTRLVPTPGNPGFGDITSTLVFIAAAEHDGIVIQCSDLLTPSSVSLAGMSSCYPTSYL